MSKFSHGESEPARGGLVASRQRASQVGPPSESRTSQAGADGVDDSSLLSRSYLLSLIPLLALITGAVGIAGAPVISKLVMNWGQSLPTVDPATSLSPVAVAFWRMALATPVLVGIAILSQVRRQRRAAQSAGGRLSRASQPPKGPSTVNSDAKRLSYLVIIPGLFFACDLSLWHWAFEFTSVANATLEANLAVFPVAFISWRFLGERLSSLFVVGLILAVSGMVLVVGNGLGFGPNAWRGDVLAFGAAFAYAGYILSVKVVGQGLPPTLLAAVTTGVAAVALGVLALLLPGGVWPSSDHSWTLLVTLALASQVVGQGLIIFALQTLPAGASVVTLMLQPVLTAIGAWYLLGQELTAWQIIGGLIVLLGIVLARQGSRAAKLVNYKKPSKASST